MSRRLHLSAEHGFTMAAVMLVMLATSILAGRRVRGRRRATSRSPATSQDRKQAYAAAEAGIEYYLYQLTRDNDYWTNCADVDDPGDGQPSPVNLEDPGAHRTLAHARPSTEAQVLDRAAAGQRRGRRATRPTRGDDARHENSGTFRIRSTGVSRGVKRSIVTTLRRTSFLDYLYFTDYEASDPLTLRRSTTDQNTRAHATACSTARSATRTTGAATT